MRLDHGWIVAHIPHQARMCLLDTVLSWDPDSIHCSASSHRLPDHPLRAHGRLGAACLIEYAAQAMAVHGALLASSPARATPAAAIGMLASARSVELLVADLDSISTELSVRALRRHGDARGALYEFEVGSATRLLARGRASVLLDSGAHSPRPSA
jgi:predicted hotdog family 3-hydroxylacyl-ACP dehydratase